MWFVFPLRRLIAVAFFAVAPIACAADPPEIIGVASVIDGDTIEIRGTRIRLHGIDAPESSQTCEYERRTIRCGQLSALFLDNEIGGKTAGCRPRGVDRYGRQIATCWRGKTDLNARMVRAGWAVAYRQYSKDYVDAEDKARADQRGLWRTKFQMPWNYRKTRRAH